MNKVIISFTAGIIIGVLFAPSKGKKTRKKLNKLCEAVKHDWNSATSFVAGKIDKLKKDKEPEAEFIIAEL
ncbi:MAG: YtxH domain-containing protein [Niastella sp.]|nr:YtxH domain-containing protein [Niastella sp.]